MLLKDKLSDPPCTSALLSAVQNLQALQVSCHLYGFETWTLLADSEKKDPGCQNQAPEETSPHLLGRAQDQQLGAEQD